MHIEIDHNTIYTYEHPARYGVQEFRLTPKSTKGQKIIAWSIDAPGFAQSAQFSDAWGNTVHLVNQLNERQDLPIRVRGLVETLETGGVAGMLANEPASRIFLRSTDLTRPDAAIQSMVDGLQKGSDQVALCHALMVAIAKAMRFDTGATHSGTTAMQAFASGSGVCQDFSHVFITACRLLGQPARYVTGYLLMPGDPGHSDAHHAWAETEIKGLGWVGFDPANGICPDERYVRLSSGPDASYAAPVRGLRRGPGKETLTVTVSVSVPAVSQFQTQQ